MKQHAVIMIGIVLLVISLIGSRGVTNARSGMMPMPGMYEETRTIEDLSTHPATGQICLVDYEAILRDSYEKLKKDPDNSQLKQKVIHLAKLLSVPQTPPLLAWQILIDHGILTEGMETGEAYLILGNPTDYWHREPGMMGGMPVEKSKSRKELYLVAWSYNYRGAIVAPALTADVNDVTHTLSNWQVMKR